MEIKEHYLEKIFEKGEASTDYVSNRNEESE